MNRRSWIVGVAAVLGVFGAAEAATVIRPPAEAQATICVGIGRIIGISDCFGGMRDYAPIPRDYYAPPPPPPPPAPATTTAPPPPPAP